MSSRLDVRNNQGFKIIIILFTIFYTNIYSSIQAQTDPDHPNILLIIADDLGVDVSNGYHQGNLMPTTPTLDTLRSTGITFENVFAAPKCTPSRAGIMSGKYGIKTGVTGTPDNLDTIHTSLFREIALQTDDVYADALIGKWHISSNNNITAPAQHGIDYYMGLFGAGVSDYYEWTKTENGVMTQENNYVTSVLTNAAIGWIENQNQPWFMWYAHAAPHSPIHEPPSHMYTISPTGNNFRKYLAMIEAIDYELNRLLESLTETVRNNTIIIYIGDNGTPNNLLQDYPTGHGKSSLYQGGIRVPMIISGAGVSRLGSRESALVHISDLYATILEVAGAELPGGLFNSLSFKHVLNNEPGPSRIYNYSEIENEDPSGHTIRNDRYKLIEFEDGSQEMYDLILDSLEFNNLLASSLNEDQALIKADLEFEAEVIRAGWSCRDHIQNGEETDIDCNGGCSPCQITSTSEPLITSPLTIFPNPGSDHIHVDTQVELIKSVVIYDVLGRVKYHNNKINSTEINIDISTIKDRHLYIKVNYGDQSEIITFTKI